MKISPPQTFWTNAKRQRVCSLTVPMMCEKELEVQPNVILLVFVAVNSHSRHFPSQFLWSPVQVGTRQVYKQSMLLNDSTTWKTLWLQGLYDLNERRFDLKGGLGGPVGIHTAYLAGADPSGSGKAVSLGNNWMLPWPRLFEPSLSCHEDLGLPWRVRSGVGCGSEMLWFRRVLNFKAEKFDLGETDPQRIPSFYLRREARNTPRPETDARNIPLRPLRELPEVGKSF